jgi:hypothetical protein
MKTVRPDLARLVCVISCIVFFYGLQVWPDDGRAVQPKHVAIIYNKKGLYIGGKFYFF